MKVLIVDDEDFLRQFYAMGFEREGWTVLHADNGLDGLQTAEKELPDVILLDIVMPGMHGFEVCRRLRENPALDRTPVIITSAKSYKPDVDKALQLGADAYVVKPVEFDELFKISLEHFHKRSGATA